MTVKLGISVLPFEIIEIVLSQLSVKSLLRFKTVCKSWNAMISDPIFMKNHLYQSKTSNSHNLFLLCKSSMRYNSEEFSLVKFEDPKFRTVQLLKTPCGLDTVLCYCDGVLLLTDFSYTKFGLWNPSTRKQTTTFLFPYKFGGCSKRYGLCHDPNNAGDFNVIVICHDYYRVFSCKNNAWTCEYEFADNSLRVATRRSDFVFVDGVFYWVRFRMKHRNYLITYFDDKYGEFKTLQKPKCVEDDKPINLVELKGRLCVYCKGVRDEFVVRIWMKENINSWKELITIENVETPLCYFKPRCFVENKILIQLRHSSRFFVCSPCGKMLKDVENRVFKQDNVLYSLRLVPYIDSLYTLPQPEKLGVKSRKRKLLSNNTI